MNEPKELVWVEAEFAKQYDKLKEDAQRTAFCEYLQKCSDETKKDYKATLEIMKEDAAMFKGLMIEVRKEFQKFADEHFKASYELWENYNKDLPKTKEKVMHLVSELKPLTSELQLINNEIKKISTWDIEKLTNTLEAVTQLRGKSKEIFDFVVTHYREENCEKVRNP